MLIYRGAGFLTLFTPLVLIMLSMWLWPDPSVKYGDTSLTQFLWGAGIGSVINMVLGFILNRKTHPDGVRHHFFYVPMQWPALIMAVACLVVALVKH